MLKLKEERTETLVFTGGEPTIRPDFFELLKLAQRDV